jgi:hypothetical protein
VEKFLKYTKYLLLMTSMPREICFRLNKFENAYNISSILFTKYKAIFQHLFNTNEILISCAANQNLSSPTNIASLSPAPKSVNEEYMGDASSPEYNRKSNRFDKQPISPSIHEVFKIGWLLFIVIKGLHFKFIIFVFLLFA